MATSKLITKIAIKNYKIFEALDLQLNDELNLIVGNNEVGKSTILEAINLALTRRLNGRALENELTPYLFNSNCTKRYLTALREGETPEPPQLFIELYFSDLPEFAPLQGTNNSKRENCPGVRLELHFDDEYREEYASLVAKPENITLIPTEYYKVRWHSFADHAITPRSLPIRVSYIDATTIRLQSGTDYYLQDIIKNDLDPKERVGLNLAYRNLKEAFAGQDAIKGINNNLTSKKGAITNKDLSISIDISHKSNWETNLVPHLDELPFHYIGKGEQNALKVMLALQRRADDANLILIEEPENHLSYSSMNTLITKIRERCAGKQILITTHSTYVLNKLGLENLLLLNATNKSTTMTELPADTQTYFKRLPGYDTLRLVLSKKAILVEGPSDELVVQRAYKDKYGHLPIEDGVDVISLRGLSAPRFLDIAKNLAKDVVVVADNDGDYARKVDVKYATYSGCSSIKICRSDDNAAKTLEPQMIKANGLAALNKILGTACADAEELRKYMEDRKTECALKIFETAEPVIFPDYVTAAIG